MKNDFKSKNLPHPVENKDAVCKNYINNIFLENYNFP